MQLALIGYGKMGKAIERIALERGHHIVARLDIHEKDSVEQLKLADVAIEFTQPDAAPGNLRMCLEHRIPVVCGTTGWLDHRHAIESYCREQQGTLFYASNYSLGVNLFFKVNEYLAKIMNRYPDYEVTMEETHHTQKKDAPSGTAITLAEGILSHLERKKAWISGDAAQEEQISIHSFRVDPTPGTHVVTYQSAMDAIEIKHTAYSREGFALGAVLVAEWIKDKKGVLTMTDFLSL